MKMRNAGRDLRFPLFLLLLLPAPLLAEKKPLSVREQLQKNWPAVDIRFDQPYAGNTNPHQMVDLYLPKKRASDKPLPVVVHIHGGGWSGGDRRQPGTAPAVH